MKTLILILCLLPCIALCQEQDSLKGSPGTALIEFTTAYYAGTAFMIVGAGMTTLGIFQDQEPVMFIGMGLSAAGFLVTIVSFAMIGKAGKLMNDKGIGIASNGAGISYRF